MNKKYFVIAGSALAVVATIVTAGPAGATELEYLDDLKEDGFTGSDSQMLNWGYRVCTDGWQATVEWRSASQWAGSRRGCRGTCAIRCSSWRRH